MNENDDFDGDVSGWGTPEPNDVNPYLLRWLVFAALLAAIAAMVLW